jgi:hypothetical protein
MLVLTERLEGYDTFLTGTLEVHGEELPVRILTLDDVTVLRLGGGRPWARTTEWEGTLHLSHGARTLIPPDDLTALARDRRLDLTTLDEADLRYALTFLGEATTASIRAGRAAVIVEALPELDDGSASSS